MILYVVSVGEHDGKCMAGVYSTEAKARDFITTLPQFQAWTIYRVTVDGEAYEYDEIDWDGKPTDQRRDGDE